MEELVLPVNNLYSSGRLIEINEHEGLLVRDVLVIVATEKDRFHTVMTKDTLDGLAYKYYKDQFPDPSKYWWVIADANLIMNPLDISDLVGTDILIPDLNRIKLQEE